MEIGPTLRLKLKGAGIRTAEKLLEQAKSAKGRQILRKKLNRREGMLLHVANLVDRMRVKGVGQEYAELLEAAGVVTVNQLKFRSPAKLAKAMAEANAKRKLCPSCYHRFPPIEHWIDEAKKLPLKISY